MKLKRKIFLGAFALLSALLMTACGDKNAEKPTPSSAPAASSVPATPAPVTPAAPEAATGPVVAFDIEKIPVSEKPLGEFPFFTPPEGYRYTSFERPDSLDEKESLKAFSRHYFAVGKETLHAVEGKILKGVFYGEKQGSKSDLETLLLQRNYENAITAAGGVKVFDGVADYEKTNGALDRSEESQYTLGVNRGRDQRQTYVIHRPDAEVWVEISCDISIRWCYFAVAQKGEMKQSVGLIPASEMKAALDKDGHVALYINFDVDKATIRPDSEPIVAEIVKLLEANPDLKIRIEGHTDNTGADDHNQTLSKNRAASVYGALLTKGIAQDRLQSAGFGAAKPIADNTTEEGKAKNRRVEIVKL